MKKNINEILSQIALDSTRDKGLHRESLTGAKVMTSLGMPAICKDESTYYIDLSAVKVFSGITTFTRMLMGEIIEQCRTTGNDIWVQHKIDSGMTPELADTGLVNVCVYARNSIANSLINYPDKLLGELQFIFSAVQSYKWGTLLFPNYFDITLENEQGGNNTALLFPFHIQKQGKKEEPGYYFLVEHEKQSHFLRITIENARDSRLQLRHIHHRVVTRFEQQESIGDFTAIADSISRGILIEWRNDHDIYYENESQQAELLHTLQHLKLSSLTTIAFHWPMDKMNLLDTESQLVLGNTIAKILLLLTDINILTILASENCMNIDTGKQKAYLEMSHKGKFLNVSLIEPRKRLSMEYFLDRMPDIKRLTENNREGFKNTRVFFIHHTTAEVLGMIKAMKEMGCSGLHTFFIKYAGMVPSDYLESMLAMPESQFQFHSLQQSRMREQCNSYYSLSEEYSSINGLEKLNERLKSEAREFFPAMKLAAGHLFFLDLIRCRNTGEKMVLIEDGGYLAPVINQICMENRLLGEVLHAFGVLDEPEYYKDISIAGISGEIIPDENELKMPLADWLAPFFLGSSEVTRNGHNRVKDVEDEYQHLAFPACSIAVSDLKRGWEAKENSAAILSATETILGSMGLLLSQRQALVLGSRGAIGSNIMRDLSYRIEPLKVAGVDLAVDSDSYEQLQDNDGCRNIERRFIEELPKEILYNTDLFVGIIGVSILNATVIEDILIKSNHTRLFFVSGSTKTMEFEQLSNYIDALLNDENPCINGIPVEIEVELIRDPQSRITQGRHIQVTINPDLDDTKGKTIIRHLYLLAELMPINFLYYGTPCEVIDHVMRQLLQVSVGLINSGKNTEPKLPGRLLSVDYQIDDNAQLIEDVNAVCLESDTI